MVAWLVGAVTQLAGCWLPAGHMATTPSPSGLMAVAAVALTGMLVAFLAHGARIAAAVTARRRAAPAPGRPRRPRRSPDHPNAGCYALYAPVCRSLSRPPPAFIRSGNRWRVRAMFSFFFTLFDGAVRAGYHLVSGFAVALAPLAGDLATAAAIAAFTVAVRLVLLPLSYYAIRGQAAQARLAPQVVALRQRHARQPERLQRELTELYRREGTGMFAGYLPMLLPLPFFALLYRA